MGFGIKCNIQQQIQSRCPYYVFIFMTIILIFYRYILTVTIVLGNQRSETCFFDRLVSLLFRLGNQKKCLYFKSSDRPIVPVFYGINYYFFFQFLKVYTQLKTITKVLLPNEVSIIFSPIRLYLCEFRILNGGFRLLQFMIRYFTTCKID